MKALMAFLLIASSAVASDWDLWARADYDLFTEEQTAPTVPDYDLGPDRLVIVYAEWCPTCPATVRDALEGLAVMVGAHHGWTFGNTEDRMIQFVDADEHQEFVASLDEHLNGGLEMPFIGKLENNEIVRQWQHGCTEVLDEWTLGWVYKGVDERPKPAPQIKATVERSGGYPLRGRWWSVEGVRRPSKSFIVSHLMGGKHRGKFNRNWLNSLSLSELHSVHSDDHEERLKWQYVNGTQQVSVTQPAKQPVKQPTVKRAVRSYQYCPTCPTSRRRFRRWR